ncbi:MAG TPA: CYTH domain-containing protein [Methylococcaceae bacterium]|nr:CYTH domain-containing protein [Methylococcaceae bacterium]
MALEIERKFLLLNDDWRRNVRESYHLRQGYLNAVDRCSVRVRTCGNRAWLNIKGATVGAQRLEFEYEIPLADADTLLTQLSQGPVIEKTRYLVDVGAHTWEIDVFEGENAGLVVAEIELEHADEAFVKPSWAGEEVTHDIRYYNTMLARDPFRNWPENAG